MAFHINEFNDIYLTRGDSLRLDVSVSRQVDGSKYVIADGDVLLLTVKKNSKKAEIIFQVEANEYRQFVITPSMTSSIEYGEYKYDVQLTTELGEVYTIIPPAKFMVGEEITW